MRGTDVLALQRLVNQRFEEWRIGIRVAEDGEFGAETRKAARRVAYGLGRPPPTTAGITPALRSKLRRPSRRTARRARTRAPPPAWLRKLRAAHTARAPTRSPRTARSSAPPYHGTHTRGNWQSDNALDIRVPVGTRVIALADGEIVKTFNAAVGPDRRAGR